MMDRSGVSRVLDQMASLLELKGENIFRVRAFRTASRAVAGLSEDLELAIADGSLAATEGIGPAIFRIVTDLVRTGRSRAHEELRAQSPPGLVDLLAIPGLGVAKVRMIHERLGIASLPDLEAAAQDGRLATVPGFGPRSCENVLKGLAYLRRSASQRLVNGREGE